MDDHHGSFLKFIEDLESLRKEKKLTPHVAQCLIPDISANTTNTTICVGQEGPADIAKAPPSSPSKEGETCTHS